MLVSIFKKLYEMKILIICLITGIFLSTKVFAEMATCFAGECEFYLSLWYDYAETLCMDTLMMEEVETGPISFTIVSTGEECLVFNER